MVTGNRFAITRRPSPRMAQAELTHMPRGGFDLATAELQHAAYRAALVEAEFEIIDLPALADHPDCAFVEDAAILLPELAILTRPGAVSRRGEIASIAAVLPTDRPVASIAAPATLDGGDVLCIGRTLFVGQSSRTNAAALVALRHLLAPYDYAVVPVAVGGALHLKTAITALDDATVLLNPAWIDASPFDDFERVTVAPDEPFGANILCVGDHILAQTSAPRTAERLVARGYQLEAIDIGEFATAEAGLTCLSIIGYSAESTT